MPAAALHGDGRSDSWDQSEIPSWVLGQSDHGDLLQVETSAWARAEVGLGAGISLGHLAGVTDGQATPASGMCRERDFAFDISSPRGRGRRGEHFLPKPGDPREVLTPSPEPPIQPISKHP